MDDSQYIRMCNDAAKLSYGDVDAFGPQRALHLSRTLQPGDRVLVSGQDELFSGTLEHISDTISSVRVGDKIRLVATAQLTSAEMRNVKTNSASQDHKVTMLARFRAHRKD